MTVLLSSDSLGSHAVHFDFPCFSILFVITAVAALEDVALLLRFYESSKSTVGLPPFAHSSSHIRVSGQPANIQDIPYLSFILIGAHQ